MGGAWIRRPLQGSGGTSCGSHVAYLLLVAGAQQAANSKLTRATCRTMAEVLAVRKRHAAVAPCD